MKAILLVGLGGGMGSAMRYLVGLWMVRFVSPVFPPATFAVNVLGCLLMGILLGIAQRSDQSNQALHYLLVVGFCGGFTTFSTFAAENVQLLQAGQSVAAVGYALLTFVLCLAAVWIGQLVVRFI